MKNISTKTFFIIAVCFVLTAGFLLLSDYYVPETQAAACQNHDLSGYAWSSNIGWISFSCKNEGAGVDYGVDIAGNGNLSGYAWSSNIGWISFNENDVTGCPVPNTDNECKTKLAGINLKGWARAVRAITPGGQTLGGWDGWIRLDGSGYGSTVSGNEFTGWAWGGDDDLNEANIGWISFNCSNQGVCGQSDYKVTLSNSSPITNISCNPLSCEGYAGVPGGFDGSLDIIYSATDPDNDIQSCDFQIDGGSKSANCSGTYLVTGQGLGNHNASIMAVDDYGVSATSLMAFVIRKDIYVNFDCSLDNIDFYDCSTVKPKMNQMVYFQDTSTPSEGATIDNWSWTFQNASPISSNQQNSNAKFIDFGDNDVTLTITDDGGRIGFQTKTFSTKIILKPGWREWKPE